MKLVEDYNTASLVKLCSKIYFIHDEVWSRMEGKGDDSCLATGTARQGNIFIIIAFFHARHIQVLTGV